MDVVTPADKAKLLSFIERIERLEVEKKEIGSDITEVYSEAKSQGYDTKIMRQIIKIRKMDPSEREEYDYLIETYKTALGIE